MQENILKNIDYLEYLDSGISLVIIFIVSIVPISTIGLYYEQGLQQPFEYLIFLSIGLVWFISLNTILIVKGPPSLKYLVSKIIFVTIVFSPTLAILIYYQQMYTANELEMMEGGLMTILITTTMFLGFFSILVDHFYKLHKNTEPNYIFKIED